MTFKFSQRSLKNLKNIHPDLVRVMQRALSITNIDFMVIEGVRTLERQTELKARGASKTLNSRHLTGHAVDIVPIINGEISWHNADHVALSHYVKQAAKLEGVPLEWGGDWKNFFDGAHYQLPWRQYPRNEKSTHTPMTDTTVKQAKAQNASAAAVAVGSGASLAPVIEKVVDVVQNQQDELTSGDWLRMAVAVCIIGLTIWFVWRRT